VIAPKTGAATDTKRVLQNPPDDSPGCIADTLNEIHRLLPVRQ